MKQLRVNALQNGTVIDHIQPSRVFTIARILGAQSSSNEVLIGTNLQSKKLGSKGVIKLSDVFLNEATVDKIAMLAPGATIIRIKNYEVVSKKLIKMPSHAVDIARCFNPNCITNHERTITRFKVLDKQDLKLQCHYCEKIMKEPQIEFQTIR